MKIELITPEQFNELMSIYNRFPNLHLQNNGYEYIKKDTLTSIEINKIEEIENILKNHIYGFIKFSNFRISKKENLPQIRIQYNYSYDDGRHFEGVGYILIEELLNGFKN